MIAAELAQRSFVQLKKNLAQCLGFRMPGGETLSVNLTQRVDGRVSVFVADLTVVVAVSIVETCVAHGALHCAYSESILLPRPNGNLAPQPGTKGEPSRRPVASEKKAPSPPTAAVKSSSAPPKEKAQHGRKEHPKKKLTGE
jgi:hypothetical protein